MAECSGRLLRLQADTYHGQYTQSIDDSIFQLSFGQVAYLRDNHLPTECDICRLQDAFGCPMSNSLNVPMAMHFRYSMGWPQKARSDIHAFPSTDSAHFTFCSDLEPAELEGRQSAAFKYQPTLGHAESQASDSRTPTSGLWPLSSPSRCTGGTS